MFGISIAVVTVVDIAFLAGFTNDSFSLWAFVNADVFIEEEVRGASLADFAVVYALDTFQSVAGFTVSGLASSDISGFLESSFRAGFYASSIEEE